MLATRSQQTVSPVPELLKQAAELLTPKLERFLKPKACGGLSLSFHIQDGRLNHIKDGDEDRLGDTGTPPADGKALTTVDQVLKEAIRVLKVKLAYSLIAGFHGYVLLALEIDDGKCIMVTCSSERVHKVASPRIPA